MGIAAKSSEDEMKITDKRKFTPEGELREEYRDPATEVRSAKPEADPASESTTPTVEEPTAEPATGDEPTAAEHAASSTAPTAEAPAAEGPAPQVDLGDLGPPEFMELLEMLLQPALVYLGDLPLPDGQPSENLPLARRQIDLLRVLKAKTEGNLSSQESSVLEDLLYRLQLRYVQKTS